MLILDLLFKSLDHEIRNQISTVTNEIYLFKTLHPSIDTSTSFKKCEDALNKIPNIDSNHKISNLEFFQILKINLIELTNNNKTYFTEKEYTWNNSTFSFNLIKLLVDFEFINESFGHQLSLKLKFRKNSDRKISLLFPFQMKDGFAIIGDKKIRFVNSIIYFTSLTAFFYDILQVYTKEVALIDLYLLLHRVSINISLDKFLKIDIINPNYST